MTVMVNNMGCVELVLMPNIIIIIIMIVMMMMILSGGRKKRKKILTGTPPGRVQIYL
jgi:preprotein translocase subunit YajC